MSSQKETIPSLTLEIRNLAHHGWEDRPNAEFLFREIGKRAQKIAELAEAGCGSSQESAPKCPTCGAINKWSEATAVAAYNNRHELCHDPYHRESADGWISVDERLPEKSDEYLVAAEDGDVFAADFFISLEHIRQSKWMTVRSYGVDCEEQELYGVTHWRFLPKPPGHAQKEK